MASIPRSRRRCPDSSAAQDPPAADPSSQRAVCASSRSPRTVPSAGVRRCNDGSRHRRSSAGSVFPGARAGRAAAPPSSTSTAAAGCCGSIDDATTPLPGARRRLGRSSSRSTTGSPPSTRSRRRSRTPGSRPRTGRPIRRSAARRTASPSAATARAEPRRRGRPPRPRRGGPRSACSSWSTRSSTPPSDRRHYRRNAEGYCLTASRDGAGSGTSTSPAARAGRPRRLPAPLPATSPGSHPPSYHGGVRRRSATRPRSTRGRLGEAGVPVGSPRYPGIDPRIPAARRRDPAARAAFDELIAQVSGAFGYRPE